MAREIEKARRTVTFQFLRESQKSRRGSKVFHGVKASSGSVTEGVFFLTYRHLLVFLVFRNLFLFTKMQKSRFEPDKGLQRR